MELHVIDRGPGIPRAERNGVFLPFQRLGDTSTSTSVGLGLALSRGLTEAMGGTLNPYGTQGGGLTMVLSLPAATSAAPLPVRRTQWACTDQSLRSGKIKILMPNGWWFHALPSVAVHGLSNPPRLRCQGQVSAR